MNPLSLTDLKLEIEKVPSGSLQNYNITFWSKWHKNYWTFGCKESANLYSTDNLVICYRFQKQAQSNIERFLSLCKLLKVPVKKKDIQVFESRNRTWMHLDGWCNENPLNREIARFLAKCSIYASFKSIKGFSKSHYLACHYTVEHVEGFQQKFLNFFSNLKSNLAANKEVVVGSGIASLLKHNKLTFVQKPVK